jgi:DNA polymerase-3 subunit delta
MIKVENLEKELKQGNLNGIYLLYGKETFLLESSLKKIKSNFGELIPGINYIKIDNTNVNNIISDIETPAFGFEKKLIIARDTGLFKKDGRRKVQLNQEIVDKVENYIKDNIKTINESVVLVFVEQEADKNSLYKTIDELGNVCDFEELEVSQIIARIKAICKAYKVTIDDYTIKYLIDCLRNKYARYNK